MSNVAQNQSSRPRRRSRHHRELAAAMRAEVSDPKADAPLAAVLLAGLGNRVFETTPGMAILAEALSTFRVLEVLQQIGGYSDQDENDLMSAMHGVRLRLETAFTLIHLESTMEQGGHAEGDHSAADDDHGVLSHAAEE